MSKIKSHPHLVLAHQQLAAAKIIVESLTKLGYDDNHCEMAALELHEQASERKQDVEIIANELMYNAIGFVIEELRAQSRRRKTMIEVENGFLHLQKVDGKNCLIKGSAITCLQHIMVQLPSSPIEHGFTECTMVSVGETGWYLEVIGNYRVILASIGVSYKQASRR